MIEVIGKYLTVYFSSTVKFIGGPVFGYFSGLSIPEIMLFTTLGMMTTVVVVSLLGRKIKSSFFKNRKKRLFTRKNRKIVYIWRRWGLPGVAFLTPILFSPIIGSAVAAAFGEKPVRIFLYMLLSAVLWSFLYSYLFFKAGDIVLPLIGFPSIQSGI